MASVTKCYRKLVDKVNNIVTFVNQFGVKLTTC